MVVVSTAGLPARPPRLDASGSSGREANDAGSSVRGVAKTRPTPRPPASARRSDASTYAQDVAAGVVDHNGGQLAAYVGVDASDIAPRDGIVSSVTCAAPATPRVPAGPRPPSCPRARAGQPRPSPRASLQQVPLKVHQEILSEQPCNGAKPRSSSSRERSRSCDPPTHGVVAPEPSRACEKLRSNSRERARDADSQITPVVAVPEEGYSEEFFHTYCGTADLLSIRSLNIQLDAAAHSIDCLGHYLQNLRELRLVDSSVMYMRELGAGLAQLEVLWMSRCSLQELGGVACIPSLKELYISFNDVTNLQPLTALEHLGVLDIEGNAVSDLDDVGTLWICPKLHELTLLGNPLCRTDKFSPEAVFALLPQLKVLDDMHRDGAQGLGTSASTQVDPDMYLDLYLESDDGLYLDLFLDAADTASGVVADSIFENGVKRETSRESCFSHPRLVSALHNVTPLEGAGNSAADFFLGEPDDQELLLEQLKRARGKATSSAAVLGSYVAATASTPRNNSSGFSLQLTDRRQRPRSRSVSVDPVDARAASLRAPVASPNCAVGFSDMPTGPREDAASVLTCGNSLAGNPLTAARQRRSGGPTGATARESGLNIRELVRRHQA